MVSRPLIGITTHGRDGGGRFRLKASYVDSVRRAGGTPLALPPGESDVEPLLTAIDALLLTGGGDVDPVHYDGAGHATLEDVDPERDRSELALARRAHEIGLPIFGICRGAQVLNVALGGTLVPHLPDRVGAAIAHRPEAGDEFEFHEVSVDSGSRLARILGTTRCSPPSWHHQAVDRIAPGLTVVARSADETIEAFEDQAHPHLVAVQWHPEVTADRDPTQQRLFDALVEAARSARGGRRSIHP